jgi:glycyl-tRNA synthetase beta chain
MVGEFPELQGLMGGYYAAKEGLPQEVADAIRDHYKPVGQGDEVPTAPVTVAVSLADKLDTICGFFLINERPTGSKDPFALRRAAIGVLELVLKNGLRMETMHFFARAAGAYARQLERRPEFQGEYADGLGKLLTPEFYGSVTDFVLDRLKVQQRTSGVRHDLIDAVAAVGDDQPVRLLARVHALQAFVGTEDGTNLLAGYKRAANILKKEGYEGPTGTPDPKVLASLKEGNDTIPDTGEEDPLALVDDPDVGDILAAEARDNSALSYTPEEAEKALIDALDSAAPRAAQAVEAERFADAMAALATLRAPIDRFFEEVTVNDPDAEKRAARLALLARFRDAVHRVADFSRIEG